MPVRKGKAARVTLVHDNSRRPRRGRGDWFDEYFRDLYDEDWNPTHVNEQVKEEEDDDDTP